jgi:zinc protease
MKNIVAILISFLIIQSSFGQTAVIDRSKPPKAGPAPVITIGNPVMYKLPNGLTVLVVENHKLPTVRANLRIDVGPVTEGSKAGVLGIMGSMLNEGTTSKTKAQFDEAVDILGANVGLSSGGGSVSAMTRYFDKAFGLMAEGLLKPSFPKESFDKLISQELTGLKTIERSASSISDRVVNALAYGPKHPSGEFETEASIKSITLDDVKAAYKKYITPSRAYLTFVGDIKPAAAKALAEKAFGAWKGVSVPLEKPAAVPNPVKTEINVIDVPNAVQAEITVVNLVNIPMSSPDYFPVLLANKILGGGAEARLFMNLREKHGYTYGAYSNIGTGRFQSDFNASASVRNEKVDSAVREFLNEINRIRNEKVSAKELQDAKSQYNGSFALAMENPSRTADFASNILINKLSADFYRTYLKKINAVTVDDIQRVAKKYFNYNNTRVVVVGKQEQIEKGLKSLGYEVKYYDKYAVPVKTDATASLSVKADVSPAQVIDAYMKAIGGKDALEKVNSTLATGKMEIVGQPVPPLPVTVKQMAPNKELMEVSMGGNVLMKNVFDGASGYMMQMGQKKVMEGDDLKEKAAIKGIFEQLFYSGSDYKLEVKGVEKLNNNDVYVLQVTPATGDAKKEYYDVKTGFLVKSEGASSTVEFSDYRKVGDIFMPHKLTALEGPQEIIITIESIKVNEGVSVDDFK